jgi:large subunit ribosomal protein L29
MARVAELRGLSEDELTTKLVENQSELFNLRFQVATAQLANVARIRTLKREIARISTLLRERELGLTKGGE